MIRPFTCLCMLLAGGAGLYLYQEKHRTTLLDREIARTIHATAATRAQTEQLRTDWAVLNEPDRLRGLADHFLTLATMQPTQWVQWGQWNDLAGRLPAPRTQPASDAAPAGGTDEDVAADTPATAAPAAANTLQAAAAQAPRPAVPAHAAPAAAGPALLASLPALAPSRAAAPKAVVASPAVAVPAAATTVLAGGTTDAHAAPHRAAHPEHAPDPAHPRDPAAHELAMHEAREPAIREAAVQSSGRPILAPVLSALAGPMRGYATAPMVSRAAAMVPVPRPGAAAYGAAPAMTAAYGGTPRLTTAYGAPIVSAIGGIRGSLPAPTPMGAATPYGGDR